MWAALRRWPLLIVAIVLTATYVTMSGTHIGDDGPRTFVGALAAMTLGAALYAVARESRDECIDRRHD